MPKYIVIYYTNLASYDYMLDTIGTIDYTTLLNTSRGLYIVAR